MRAWTYYAWHTFINSIRKFFRKSTILTVVIFAIIGVSFVVGVTAGVTGFFSENEFVEDSEQIDGADSTANIDETVEKEKDTDAGKESDDEKNIDSYQDNNTDDLEEDYKDEELTAEDIAEMKVVAEAILAIVIFLILLYGLKTGQKNGAMIFQMADVNFLFPSPMRPQAVLLFRLLFQLSGTVWASVYLLFQMPALAVEMGLGTFSVLLMVAAYILLLIYIKLMSLLSYVILATKVHLRKFLTPFLCAVIVLVAAVSGLAYLACDQDLLMMLQHVYASTWSRFIPIVGWMKGLVMCAVEEEWLMAITFLVLLLAGAALLMRLIWLFPADFYEDALVAAAEQEKLTETIENGGLEQGKERSKRIRRNTGMKGQGASAFFWKGIYNRRRFSFLGLFSKTMGTYAGVTLVLCLVVVKFMDGEGFFAAGVAMLVILFFRNYGNPIATESSRNWLVMVPESPYRKVLCCMLCGTADIALDLIPAMVIGLCVSRTPVVEVLLWYPVLLAADFMFSSLGQMLEAIFPASDINPIRGLVQFLLKFLMGAFLVIVLFVGTLLLPTAAVLCLVTVAALGLGAICFVFYPAFLHNGV